MPSRSEEEKQPDEDDIDFDELVMPQSEPPWPLSLRQWQRDIQEIRAHPGRIGTLFYIVGGVCLLGSYVVASVMGELAMKAWNVLTPIVGSSFGKAELIQGPGKLVSSNNGLLVSISHGGIELLPGLFGFIGVCMFLVGFLIFTYGVFSSLKDVIESV